VSSVPMRRTVVIIFTIYDLQFTIAEATPNRKS
jgi:hypothetical protein